MKIQTRRIPALWLTLCMALLLTACGGEGKAASMWLVKTEGTVNVSDGKDANVELTDRLGLFSGYKVKTRSESYGWIDLDDVKLTKLDQNSRVDLKFNLTENGVNVYFDQEEIASHAAGFLSVNLPLPE